MRLINNMMWMAGGVGVGLLASKYTKEIKSTIRKGKKELSKVMDNM